MKRERRGLVKLIVESSNQNVNFADFINEVLDFEESREELEDKQTPLKK
jgi:hypothetical protein